MSAEKKIALLGQPNSGKSTVFNMLTGAHQHVGNWPGKTVEKVEGEFTYNEMKYIIADLPGTYSLSANSDEEIVTRDYIASGGADIVCILADSSQLERSLFMLSDYAGITVPAMLVLTMTDVAEAQGKKINIGRLSEKLGIPVVSIVAPDKNSYGGFYKALEEAANAKKQLDFSALTELYKNGEQKAAYIEALALVPDNGLEKYSPEWLASKLLEGDNAVINKLSAASDRTALKKFAESNPNGSLYTSDCKFEWIDSLLSDTVTKAKKTSEILSKFDRAAISKRWGKLISIGIVLLGIIGSFIVAAPLMGIGGAIPSVLTPLLNSLGLPDMLASFINSTLITALSWVFQMAGFVFGINFVFGLIEEVGYMARVSYVFDNTMNRLGLQGKSIMPMLVSFGCTIGGAAGTRVIDSYGQRILTIALAWAVPCGATFAVIPTLANGIFGSGGAILVMLYIFALMFLHIFVTAKIFGKKLSPVEDRTGLIMELPPYHKPRWKTLLKNTFVRVWDVFRKAFVVVVIVAAIFWLLTYSSSGMAADSVIYKIGTTIEPVTKFFGMGWQTFLAFITSMVSKEAILGVMSVLFTDGSSLLLTSATASADANIGTIIANAISKPEALAFMVAVTFNVPCLMALSSTMHETHSAKWTAKIALYYIATALVLSCLTYHISGLFF